MKQSLKELQELKASFEQLDTKLQEIKAATPDDKHSQVVDMVHQMCANVHRRMDYIQSDVYSYMNNHSDGHLPKIVGADKMNKALKALGMDGDYVCNPKTVYASTKAGLTVEIDAKFKK